MQNEKKLVFVTSDIVLFPNSEIRFEISNTNEIELFDLIENTATSEVLVVNAYDDGAHSDVTMLPSVGILAELTMLVYMPNNKNKVTLIGKKRVNIHNYTLGENSRYSAEYEEIDTPNIIDEHYKTILIKALSKYVKKVPYMSNAVMNKIDLIESITELTDLIVSFVPFGIDKKKKYILEIDSYKRCKMLLQDMNDDIKYVELEEKIERQVEKEMDEVQKEYYLREKLNVIQKELGDFSTKNHEIETYKKKLNKLKCSNEIKTRIKLELNRYEATPSNSPDLSIIRDYLEWMFALPWNLYTKDNSHFDEVIATLDETHFGLLSVKSRILEYLAVMRNAQNSKCPILCLVGPPGVGKTTLALSIAKALNRKSVKISVGGINDEAEIVGHRRTYIGASPGRIIQGLRKASSANPVFIIDEIDKMRKDIKGDPASSLLEVLDVSQNSHFSDHYIEEDFDLSKVMFIATANYIEQIPYELRDRLEIIEVPSYTEYEKFDICKNYILPRSMSETGLTVFAVQFLDDAIMHIIRYYTKEAGVRELERKIDAVLRKIVKKLLTDKSIASYEIDIHMVEELLGKKKYFYNLIDTVKRIGVVNGMAYTTLGGDILPIEVTYYKGKGGFMLTGSLGDVMKESCHIALSYIKAHAQEFGIKLKDFVDYDIHIHVPEGAVSKDGPSAGVALTTALISLFTKKEVSSNLSMTGEITLSGKVLPIGGVREKVIGAHRAGIQTIYLPKENQSDLDEIDDKIKKDIHFIFIEDYENIYRTIFGGVNYVRC